MSYNSCCAVVLAWGDTFVADWDHRFKILLNSAHNYIHPTRSDASYVNLCSHSPIRHVPNMLVTALDLTEHMDEQELRYVPVPEFNLLFFERRTDTRALLSHHPSLLCCCLARSHRPNQFPQLHRHGLRCMASPLLSLRVCPIRRGLPCGRAPFRGRITYTANKI